MNSTIKKQIQLFHEIVNLGHKYSIPHVGMGVEKRLDNSQLVKELQKMYGKDRII